jgi:hypothetical protein
VEKLRKITKNLSQDCQCPRRDSNRATPACNKSTELPFLCLTSRSCHCANLLGTGFVHEKPSSFCLMGTTSLRSARTDSGSERKDLQKKGNWFSMRSV